MVAVVLLPHLLSLADSMAGGRIIASAQSVLGHPDCFLLWGRGLPVKVDAVDDTG